MMFHITVSPCTLLTSHRYWLPAIISGIDIWFHTGNIRVIWACRISEIPWKIEAHFKPCYQSLWSAHYSSNCLYSGECSSGWKKGRTLLLVFFTILPCYKTVFYTNVEWKTHHSFHKKYQGKSYGNLVCTSQNPFMVVEHVFVPSCAIWTIGR
jgi:hypothetical protein